MDNKTDFVGKSHGELYKLAVKNGWNNRSAFPRFKKALLEIGIDYNQLRDTVRAEKDDALVRSVTHTVEFYSDAKASKDRFAITDERGTPLWYGRFFDGDRDYNGEQSSGEMAAAKKAVWLASKVAAAVGGTVELTLNVDAEWLVWANEVRGAGKRGGKAKALGFAAQKLGVVLKVEHVRGVDNPADEYTVCSGFKNWRDNLLKELASEI